MAVEFTDNFRRAFSFVLHHNGFVKEADMDELLLHFKVDKGIVINRNEFLLEVEKALDYFHSLENCLFVCTNITCSKKSYFEITETSLIELSKKLDCPVVATGCHWQCENAPVITLKNGTEKNSYVRCSSDKTWNKALDEIKKVLSASFPG